MRTALALMAILAGVPAAAEECAKFDEPLAYNACLARQGPAARAVHVGAAPAGVRAPAPRVRGQIFATSRHGRSEMVFSVRK